MSECFSWPVMVLGNLHELSQWIKQFPAVLETSQHLCHMGSLAIIRHCVSCCCLQICCLSFTLTSTQPTWSFDVTTVRLNPWVLTWLPPMASSFGGSYIGLIGTVGIQGTCYGPVSRPVARSLAESCPLEPPVSHQMVDACLSFPWLHGDRHLVFDWWMNK